jgi:hypothetical protein
VSAVPMDADAPGLGTHTAIGGMHPNYALERSRLLASHSTLGQRAAQRAR